MSAWIVPESVDFAGVNEEGVALQLVQRALRDFQPLATAAAALMVGDQFGAADSFDPELS